MDAREPDWSALIEAERSALLRYVASIVGWTDAADVVQDVCVRVLVSRGDYRGEADWRTWLFAIAKNAGRQHLRRQRRRNAATRAPQALPLDEVVAQAVEGGEARTDLWRAVARLPEAQREALLARAAHGRSYEAAARSLGIRISVFRGRLGRARRAVREELA